MKNVIVNMWLGKEMLKKFLEVTFLRKEIRKRLLVDRWIGKKVTKKPPTETLTLKMATAVSAKKENI